MESRQLISGSHFSAASYLAKDDHVPRSLDCDTCCDPDVTNRIMTHCVHHPDLFCTTCAVDMIEAKGRSQLKLTFNSGSKTFLDALPDELFASNTREIQKYAANVCAYFNFESTPSVNKALRGDLLSRKRSRRSFVKHAEKVREKNKRRMRTHRARARVCKSEISTITDRMNRQINMDPARFRLTQKKRHNRFYYLVNCVMIYIHKIGRLPRNISCASVWIGNISLYDPCFI